jgi:hypothetical protein
MPMSIKFGTLTTIRLAACGARNRAMALLLILAVIAAFGPSAWASAESASARCGVASDGRGAGKTLIGGPAHDVIAGGVGNDLLRGRGGNDRVTGLGGQDCLRGGSGNDRVDGGPGRDRVRGGLGNDIVVGGAGQDLIKAGSGDDKLMALDGERDWVRCGRGNDLARVDAKDEVWGCERTLHRPHDGGGGSGGRGYPSLAHIDWDGDFDPGCRLVGGQGGSDSKVAGTDHPGTVSIERSIVGEGHCAARFSTPAGHGTGRAEVARHNSKPSQTVQFEELLWIPSKANNGPDHGSITQTKMNSNPCYNGGLTLPKEHPGHLGYSTVASCSAGSRKFDLGPFPHNQWIAVKVTEKFADNGYVAVWLDPDGAGPAGYHVVLPRTRADTTPVNVGVKYRQGLYHDADPHESHIFGDGFHLDCLANC